MTSGTHDTEPETQPESVAVQPPPKTAPPPKQPDAPPQTSPPPEPRVPPQPASTTVAMVEEPPAPPKDPCPKGMVNIGAGNFEMGSRGSDPLRGFGDLSARRRSLDSYCIDIYEYPNQRGRRPRVGVTWKDAAAICNAAGKRLCSESEWERACKGPNNLRFPVGNSFDAKACNAGGSGRKTASSGVFPRCRSAFGVVDLAGNVAEWTAGRWSSDIANLIIHSFPTASMCCLIRAATSASTRIRIASATDPKCSRM